MKVKLNIREPLTLLLLLYDILNIVSHLRLEVDIGGVCLAKIIVSCEHCKREIERYPSQILKTVFCSKLCRSEYNIKNNTIAFNCLHCGEEKRVRKSSYKNNENHFCCRKCKDEWQKESLKGESNPFYERTHSKLTKESISKTKNLIILKVKMHITIIHTRFYVQSVVKKLTKLSTLLTEVSIIFVQ